MTNKVRLVVSISEEDKKKLNDLCSELGVSKSQYVSYLISGCSKIAVPPIKYQELIYHISEIDLSLRVIALKEELSSKDMLLIESLVKEIKELLYKEKELLQKQSKC